MGRKELARLAELGVGRLERGCMLFLQQVCILVGKAPFARTLNIHPVCIKRMHNLMTRKSTRNGDEELYRERFLVDEDDYS